MLIFLGIHQAEAQNTQINAQGVLLEPLKYAYRNNERVDVKATLCVINTSNEEPQWFLLNGAMGENEFIGSIAAALYLISEIKASLDETYLAVLSVGEGHPILEVIDLPGLLREKTYKVLYSIDPYPGTVEIQSWDGNRLQVGSDMLLTQMDKGSGRVSFGLPLSAQEIFALDVTTGEISAISDEAKNPLEYYSRIVTDPNASESEEDAALSLLLNLRSKEETILYLLKVLEQEQDPRRINKILELLNKLQK